MSDLHFEFGNNPEWIFSTLPDVEWLGDVIILAGDIHSGAKGVFEILKAFAQRYRHVVYITGNHEYYGSTIESFNSQLKDLLAPYNNIYFLNNESIKIKDVTFIGSTLWTNFRNYELAKHSAKSMISDFRHIKGFSPDRAVKLYEEAKEFIEYAYENIPGKKVIITHFLPAIDCISPKYRNEGLLNYYFANDLGDYIKELRDVIWCFGHTHDSIDFKINDTRLLCNPYGYFGHELNELFAADKAVLSV